MQKTKPRVSLRCADHPVARAAYQILLDPDAREEQWIEACATLQKVQNNASGPTSTSGNDSKGSSFAVAGVPDDEANQAVDLNSPQSARREYWRALLQNKRRRLTLELLVVVCPLVMIWMLHCTFLHLGVDNVRKGHWLSADYDLRTAIAICPFDERAYVYRADALNRAARFNMAIQPATQAIVLNSKNSRAYYLRAQSYYENHETVLALHDAQTATRLSPQDAASWKLLGDIQSCLYKNRDALHSYEEAARRGGADYSLLVRLGRESLIAGKDQNALEHFDNAVNMDSSDSSVMVGRGLAKERLHDFHGAKSDFEAAIPINRDNELFQAAPLAFCDLARCNNKLGDYKAAIKAATAAAEPFDDRQSFVERAIAECKLDEPQEALDDLAKSEAPMAVATSSFITTVAPAVPDIPSASIQSSELTRAEAYARLGNVIESEYVLKLAGADPDEAFYIRSIAEARSGGKAHPLNSQQYMANLQTKIKRNWFPPRRYSSFTTTTSFKVQPNGEVTDVTIERSSGDEEMDQACLQALQSSSPAAFLPPGSSRAIPIEFTFTYNSQPDKFESRGSTK